MKKLERLIWVFAVFSVFGAFYEQIIVLVQNIWGLGLWQWESRAGMVWGPLAPIYGAGAVLMVLILTWKELRPWQIFVGSAVIGGVFEFLVGFVQEHVFHTISWDYSEQFMNFGGHTSLQVMVIWGILGVILVNILYPALVRGLEKIRPEVRRGLTIILAVFLVVNALCTVVAVPRYFERKGGVSAEQSVVSAPIARFCDWAFNDDYLRWQVPNMLRER